MYQNIASGREIKSNIFPLSSLSHLAMLLGLWDYSEEEGVIVLACDPPPAGGTLVLGEDTLAETAPTEDVATDCAHQLFP